MGKITITIQDDRVAVVKPAKAMQLAIVGTAEWVECPKCARVIPIKAVCPCKGGHDPMRLLLSDVKA